jgi:hypothetical protein
MRKTPKIIKSLTTDTNEQYHYQDQPLSAATISNIERPYTAASAVSSGLLLQTSGSPSIGTSPGARARH